MKVMGVLMAVSLLLLMFVLSRQNHELYHISYDLCQHQRVSAIALKHQASYLLDDGFDAPAIFIRANSASFATIQQHINHAIDNHNHSSGACHLYHAKYHTKHINHQLTPFIPDNVDYVSYAPPHLKQDKAVYCYYDFNGQRFNQPKATSTCYFIHLNDGVLIKDNISDLERLNLQTLSYRHRGGFFNPFSHVHEWHDKSHLRYGITFHTKTNNWHYGHADIY